YPDRRIALSRRARAGAAFGRSDVASDGCWAALDKAFSRIQGKYRENPQKMMLPSACSPYNQVISKGYVKPRPFQTREFASRYQGERCSPLQSGQLSRDLKRFSPLGSAKRAAFD